MHKYYEIMGLFAGTQLYTDRQKRKLKNSSASQF